MEASQEIQAKDRLVHITDLHFWEVILNPLRLLNKRFLGNLTVYMRRRHEFIMNKAQEFGEVALGTQASTFLLTGDFTSTGTDSEFKMAAEFVRGLKKAGTRVICIPGNHDVYTFEGVRQKRFERHFEPYVEPERYPLRLTLEGGTPLILVPTVTPNMISSKGLITSAEVQQTRELLEQTPADSQVIVAAHYPVLNRTYAYDSSSSRRLRNSEELRRALGESSRQILYLAGHVHRFSYVQDLQYPNLHHLTTSAFFLKRPHEPTQGEFTEVIVAEDGFHVFRHWCEEKWDRIRHTVRPVLG